MTRLNNFQLKAFHYWIQWWHRPAQFSSKRFCSIKSTILLEMKCPQLSKPEATAARNQNSIGDRTEKKTLGETRLSRGATSPLARRHSSSIPTAAKSDWRAQLIPEVLSWWLSRWRGPHWGSVSGAHLGVLSPLTFRAVEVVSRCWSTIWSGDCSDLGIRKKQTNISIDVNLFTM